MGKTKTLQALGSFGATVVDPTLSAEGKAADAKATGDRLATIESKIADILYEPIAINSFVVTNTTLSSGSKESNTLIELGAVVNDVAFSWSFSKTPVSVIFNGANAEITSTGTTLYGTGVTGSKNWTLKVTDERNASQSKNAGVTFYSGVYHGVLEDGAVLDSFAILSGTRKLQNSKSRTFTVTAGSTQRIMYALPTDYGTPNFNVGGFDGGFYLAANFKFVNASGYERMYDVWLSSNKGLGTTTVKVT